MIGLDVHSREVHSCESVFVAENDEGALSAGGSTPTTAGGLMHLRATRSASCALPAGKKIALETGTSAFLVARELAGLNLKP